MKHSDNQATSPKAPSNPHSDAGFERRHPRPHSPESIELLPLSSRTEPSVGGALAFCKANCVVFQLEEDELRGVALLVFANKQDLPRAMSAADVTEALSLSGLSRPVGVQSVIVHTVAESVQHRMNGSSKFSRPRTPSGDDGGVGFFLFFRGGI